MQQIVNALRSLPTEATSLPPAIEALSDAHLVQATAAAIARPKASRASSFILHAPMELLARAALLPLTPTAQRPAVRLRIASIAAEYAEGEEIATPQRAFADCASALGALTGALRDADADQADAAVCHLAPRMPARALRAALADEIAPCLGAAAHAPILVAALPEACIAYGDVSCLLRAPIRTLAAESRSRLTWLDAADESTDGPGDLFEALAAPPSIVSPNLFIAPTMLAVEAHGRAARLLTRATHALSVDDALRELSRIAALSMLQDDPAHAPYGWSHCLSMPQGAVALACHARNPRRGVRAAATYVLGFRATLGKVRLDPKAAPSGVEPDITALVARAAAHRDAHLAKYTLACISAAADDPPARALYLAAADYLRRWWEANPDAGFDG
jgi:hypothetical protein